MALSLKETQTAQVPPSTYLVQKVVHPFSEYVKSAKNRYSSLASTGSKDVWVWSRRLRKYVDPTRTCGMKLKDSQVRWIVREKGRGELTKIFEVSASGNLAYESEVACHRAITQHAPAIPQNRSNILRYAVWLARLLDTDLPGAG